MFVTEMIQYFTNEYHHHLDEERKENNGYIQIWIVSNITIKEKEGNVCFIAQCVYHSLDRFIFDKNANKLSFKLIKEYVNVDEKKYRIELKGTIVDDPLMGIEHHEIITNINYIS